MRAKRALLQCMLLLVSILFSLAPTSGLPAADCNRNGIEDSLDLAAGTSRDCNGNSVPDECDLSPPATLDPGPGTDIRGDEDGFGFRDVYEFTGYFAIDSGQFDGDDRPDLVVVHRVDGKVYYLLQEKRRVFTRNGPLPFEGDAASVVAADLDGDGDGDIVISGFVERAIPGRIELLVNDGEAGFTSRLIDETVPVATAIASADLDGDGDIDLITSGLQILRNAGAATFGPPEQIDALEEPHHSIATVDLNGDGSPDIVASRAALRIGTPSTVSILVNDGAGGFSVSQTFDIDMNGVDTATAVVPADLNGDGSPDIAVPFVCFFCSLQIGSVDALLNDGQGMFTLEPSVIGKQINGPRSLAAADFDRDGDLDLAVEFLHEGVFLSVNSGDPTFTTSRDHPVTREGQVFSLLAGDLDGDELPDLAVASSDFNEFSALTVYWNETPLPASRDDNSNGQPDECEAAFHRGDPDGDGKVELTDAIFLFSHLFLGGAEPGCRDSADANDDNELDISDGIFLLGYLFLGGAPPPAPGPPPLSCGGDPDPPGLGCLTYDACPPAQ